MTQSHQNDPLPAIIETWIQQLAATRAQLHSVLVALAYIREDLTGTDMLDHIDKFDRYFDHRNRKYKFESLDEFHEETESHLLAMLRSSAAMHNDIHVLKHACIGTLSALTDTDWVELQKQIDRAALEVVEGYPAPDYTPHILRSFFRRKDNQSDPDQSSS